MKKLMIAGLALTTIFAAGAASAQPVDQRHATQERRIVQGERTGQLTRREATHLQRQQARIDRQETRLRARQHGRLTFAQRAREERRENRANRHIYDLKHNRRVG